MSHRRKSNVEKARKTDVLKAEPLNEEPYTLETGPARLILRGNELFNGWDGNCPRCNVLVQKERPAAEGLRCPECGHWLYRPGNRRDREETIMEMKARRDSSINKQKMDLTHDEKVLMEMMTGVCQFCGGELASEDDGTGDIMMHCPNCMKNILAKGDE